MIEKITQFARIIKFHLEGNLGLMLIIILVGFGGFGLGRMSVTSEVEIETKPVQILNQSASVSSATDVESVGGLLVGSRNGSKYHFPWCSGAQRMKEENKIWFDSVEEAERAGYTPAANCKGL